MITISTADLPFLRFVKRHQISCSSLRKISESPEISKLEKGDTAKIEIELETQAKDLAQLESLSDWWKKAEEQGIHTNLLFKLIQPQESFRTFAA